MQIEDTALAGVKIVTPKKIGDARGFFSETYNRQIFARAGIDLEFVQDNQSLSAEVGTIRGLHFQSPPFAHLAAVYRNFDWNQTLEFVQNAAGLSERVLPAKPAAAPAAGAPQPAPRPQAVAS